MKKEKFEDDQWIYNRSNVFFVIKHGNDVVYEPDRSGDYTDSSPFADGFIPRIGDKFSLQRRKWDKDTRTHYIDGYDNDEIVPTYIVKDIRIKIVECWQQTFKSVYYIDVAKTK